jgi:hypothetical protein
MGRLRGEGAPAQTPIQEVEIKRIQSHITVEEPVYVTVPKQIQVDMPQFTVTPIHKEVIQPVYTVVKHTSAIEMPVYTVVEKEIVIEKPTFKVISLPGVDTEGEPVKKDYRVHIITAISLAISLANLTLHLMGR